MVFPAGAPATRVFGSVPVHPAQLYASAAAFAAFGLLLLLERGSRWRGATFSWFLVFYGLSRFLVDFSRYYEPEQVALLDWSNNQWVSLGLIAVGAALLLRGARGRADAPWRAKENS